MQNSVHAVPSAYVYDCGMNRRWEGEKFDNLPYRPHLEV